MAFNDIVYRYQLNRSTNRNVAPLTRYIRTLMKMKLPWLRRHMTPRRYIRLPHEHCSIVRRTFITIWSFIYFYHDILSSFSIKPDLFYDYYTVFSVQMTRFFINSSLFPGIWCLALILKYSDGVKHDRNADLITIVM